MIPIVLDTNVLASALLSPDGLERRILLLALDRKVQLYVSTALLQEYEQVLRRPKLRLDPVLVARTLKQIASQAYLVHPMHILTVCPYEDDNRVLECADAARAAFLITGNRRHFPKRWKQTEIVSGREFANSMRLRRR